MEDGIRAAKAHTEHLSNDEKFIATFRKNNEKIIEPPKFDPFHPETTLRVEPDTSAAKTYCRSIEEEALRAIKAGNLPEASFQIEREEHVIDKTMMAVRDCSYLLRPACIRDITNLPQLARITQANKWLTKLRHSTAY